jgi:hypothetical protein
VRTWIKFLSPVIAVTFFAACGGGETPTVVKTEQKEKGKSEKINTLKDWRKDEQRGEGGSFEFTLGEEQYKTEWGYADFRILPAKDESRLIILSNPVGSKDFPKLRLDVSSTLKDIKDFTGGNPHQAGVSLRVSLDVKKGEGYEGTAVLNVDQVDDEFVAGTFSGDVNAEGQKIPIKGSFKARLNPLTKAEAGGN